MTISDDTLAEWERVVEVTTPGPWTLRDGYERSDGETAGFARIANDEHRDVLASSEGDDLVAKKVDAEFIALTRTGFPQLIQEYRELKAKNDKLAIAHVEKVEAVAEAIADVMMAALNDIDLSPDQRVAAKESIGKRLMAAAAS